MLRRTEPVVLLVPRFTRRVQSKRAAASTSWTRRFARRRAGTATGSSRSAAPVIAVTRIARRRVVRWHVARRSVPRVSDIATKYQLMKGGLGWGGLPASIVRNDLTNGSLKALELEAYEQGEYPLFSLRRVDSPAGPAGQWLAEAFQERLSACPNHKDFNGMIEANKHKPIAVAAE